MDRSELDRALAKIGVEHYLDREGISYYKSYGTRGMQLNLDECPSCHEGGRKTYINAENGLGNCFHGACGVKFNKFKLIKAVSGLSGAALDEHIASIAEEQGWMPKPTRVEMVRGELALPSKLQPAVGPDGRLLRYLADRGVTVDAARHFDLTYCKGGWWGYKLEDGSPRWISYDKRIVIPIADLTGKLVSFQGRDVTGTKDPKYLFPVGYAVAGSHLYNGQNFIEGRHTHAIVGEGAFDAVAIHQAVDSLPTMIPLATFGMHLSGGPDGQIAKFAELKRRGLTTVTIMWDGEQKALSAAVKAGFALIGVGLVARIAMLPKDWDPAQDPEKRPVPPERVRDWIFNAQLLNRLTAIRLLTRASELV